MTSAVDVLARFRDFVVQNAVVWEPGSNHHHPIWQEVANALAPPPGPTLAALQVANVEREPPMSVGFDIVQELIKREGSRATIETLFWLANRITEAVNAARLDGGWRSMDSAPRDGTVFMVWSEPGQHDLPAMFSLCSWHEDAGFCIDELRQPTLWKPLPPLDAPRASP